MKKMPIEVDMSELLVKAGMDGTATEFTKAVGDLALIAFYYLLRVEEYTVKRSQNSTKQTKQFKLEEGTVTAPVTNSTRQKKSWRRHMHLSSWIIRRIDGKECVSIMRQMERNICAASGPWGVNIAIFND